MAKFKKKTQTSEDIPTSALPDIIFMLLFFFMVTTVLREVTLLVNNSLPQASQIQKLEKKSLVSFIYVGKPKETKKYGETPRIQLNDVLANPEDIAAFVLAERTKLDEAERDLLTMSLKVDRDVKMGIVTDVRQKLRKVNALKVNYSSVPGAGQKD